LSILRISDHVAKKQKITVEIKVAGFLFGLIAVAISINFVDKQIEVYNYIPGILVYVVLSLENNLNYKFLLRVITIFISIQIFLGFLQYFFPKAFDSIFSFYLHGDNAASNYHRKIGRLTSYWLEAPRYATVLASLFPFLFYKYFKKRKFMYITLIVLSASLLFLTFTRVALFSTIIVFVIVIIYFSPKIKLKSVLFVLFGAVVGYLLLNFYLEYVPFETFQRIIDPVKFQNELLDKYDNYNRIFILIQLFPLTLKFPVLGSGRLYIDYLLFNFSSVHNSILQFILMFGYLSFILFGYLIFRNLKPTVLNFFKTHSFVLASTLAYCSILFIGLFHGVLLDGPINLFFWFLLSLTTNNYETNS